MSVLTLDIEKITIKRPGVIKPNEKGEYKIIVGGLNIYSGNGFYYKHTPKVEKILTTGVFKMKLDAGKVMSEANHPNFSVYRKESEVIERMMQIDESNALAAIVNITVVKTDKLDPLFNNPIYHIVATMVPQGPKKDELIRLFADPDAELCFSVRSFSDSYDVNGVVVKEQKMFITWDRVTNPGHYVAKKSFTNGNMLDLESIEEIRFTDIEINNIRTTLHNKIDMGLDLESLNDVNELLNVFDTCPQGGECIYNNW